MSHWTEIWNLKRVCLIGCFASPVFSNTLKNLVCSPSQIQHFCLPLSSVQFSCSVMSASLRPHELQHVRPPCLSPTPEVHPNPCSLSRWCHPTILSFVVPFSSCLQSFPASGSLHQVAKHGIFSHYSKCVVYFHVHCFIHFLGNYFDHLLSVNYCSQLLEM